MSINANSTNLQFLNSEEQTNLLVISQMTQDYYDGQVTTYETAFGCNPILIDLTVGSVIQINGNSLTLYAAASAGATTLYFNDTTIEHPILIGDKLVIDSQDLFQQYQFKTAGTVAGFAVDSDGLAKDGIEITSFLNSDTMSGASVNNLPTALSVKNYVDSSSGSSATLQDVTDNGNTTDKQIIVDRDGVAFKADSGTENKIAVFKSTDNKGYLTVGDDDTTAYIVVEGGVNGVLYIGDGASADNFKVDITNGNIVNVGTVDGVDVSALDTTVTSNTAAIATKQDALTLTTTGTSGAATLVGATLNVPQYSGGGGDVNANYVFYECSGTTTTSATAGESEAVVIPFDTSVVTSDSTDITFYDSSGPTGISNGAYCFKFGSNGFYEICWSVGTNTNTTNNRIVTGVKLEYGTQEGGTETIGWADYDPSHSYIYDRGSGSIRKGSTSNSVLYKAVVSTTTYLRVVFWKEASTTATTNSITLTDACSLTIKQLQE
jgi:hypothetical protein